jgi:hypothetical protein
MSISLYPGNSFFLPQKRLWKSKQPQPHLRKREREHKIKKNIKWKYSYENINWKYLLPIMRLIPGEILDSVVESLVHPVPKECFKNIFRLQMRLLKTHVIIQFPRNASKTVFNFKSDLLKYMAI